MSGAGTLIRFFVVFVFLSCSGEEATTPNVSTSSSADVHQPMESDSTFQMVMGPLLLPNFKSFDQFKAVVKVEYANDIYGESRAKGKRPIVRLTHQARSGSVISELKAGVSQSDFAYARSAGWWVKVKLAMRYPYAAFQKKNLMRVENLARRRPFYFGQGDVGFYHLAETMVFHITEADRAKMSTEELGEKGYLNTFNHITAQAMMTSLYDEKMADFIADMHELYNLPELASGHFSDKQLADLKEGPVDNYLDMINNEWGQELGKTLKQLYNVNTRTVWTPELLADYLNEIQQYLGWSFRIGFMPFTPSDKMVIQFAEKLNFLMRSKKGFP